MLPATFPDSSRYTPRDNRLPDAQLLQKMCTIGTVAVELPWLIAAAEVPTVVGLYKHDTEVEYLPQYAIDDVA